MPSPRTIVSPPVTQSVRLASSTTMRSSSLGVWPATSSTDAFSRQEGPALGERTRPHLGAGQVGEDGDLAAPPVGDLAHELDALDVFLGLTVRQAESYDVDPGVEKGGEHLRRVGGRADRGDDLRTAHRGGSRGSGGSFER